MLKYKQQESEWYRAGRLVNKKTGIEELDYMPTKAPKRHFEPFCTMVKSLDASYKVCQLNCGRIEKSND